MGSIREKQYELSEAASTDISNIYDYTVLEFGEKQAFLSLSGLEVKILDLVKEPSLVRGRDEIKKGLKNYRFDKHVIFYRQVKGKLRIVRVLHVRQDIARQFKN